MCKSTREQENGDLSLTCQQEPISRGSWKMAFSLHSLLETSVNLMLDIPWTYSNFSHETTKDTAMWDLANCPWWIIKDLQCVGLAHKTAIGCTKQCYTFPVWGSQSLPQSPFDKALLGLDWTTHYSTMLFYVFIGGSSKQFPSPKSPIVAHVIMVLSLFLVCPASQAHVTRSHIVIKP